LAAVIILLTASELVAIIVLRPKMYPSSSLFPPLWLLTVFMVTPFNGSAWRFSLIALVPLVVMAGAGIAVLTQLINGHGKTWRKLVALAFLALSVVAVVNGSWGAQALTLPASLGASDSAFYQEVDYSAMQWLLQYTPNSSVYYSVTDWRFTFLTLDYQRATTYQFTSSESDAVGFARDYQLTQYTIANESSPEYNLTYYLQPEYVIVTKSSTESLPQDPSLNPWNTFVANANLTLTYKSQYFEVFHLTPIPACYVTPLNNVVLHNEVFQDVPVRVCPTT
jgi:hypothetical protein